MQQVWNRMVDLAVERNIHVRQKPLPSEVLGYYETRRGKNGQPIHSVVVDQRLRSENRLYTLAHELGHATLHNRHRKAPEKISAVSDIREAQAHRFARKLLNLVSRGTKSWN